MWIIAIKTKWNKDDRNTSETGMTDNDSLKILDNIAIIILDNITIIILLVGPKH